MNFPSFENFTIRATVFEGLWVLATMSIRDEGVAIRRGDDIARLVLVRWIAGDARLPERQQNLALWTELDNLGPFPLASGNFIRSSGVAARASVTHITVCPHGYRAGDEHPAPKLDDLAGRIELEHNRRFDPAQGLSRISQQPKWTCHRDRH
jgi:hypothetical protein